MTDLKTRATLGGTPMAAKIEGIYKKHLAYLAALKAMSAREDLVRAPLPVFKTATSDWAKYSNEQLAARFAALRKFNPGSVWNAIGPGRMLNGDVLLRGAALLEAAKTAAQALKNDKDATRMANHTASARAALGTTRDASQWTPKQRNSVLTVLMVNGGASKFKKKDDQVKKIQELGETTEGKAILAALVVPTVVRVAVVPPPAVVGQPILLSASDNQAGGVGPHDSAAEHKNTAIIFRL